MSDSQKAITALRVKYGRKIPRNYSSFLATPPLVAQETDSLFAPEDFETMREIAGDILSKDGASGIDSYEHVFWIWQDVQFASLKWRSATAAATVYHYTRGVGGKDYRSFSDWLHAFTGDRSQPVNTGFQAVNVELEHIARCCVHMWELALACGVRHSLKAPELDPVDDALAQLKEGLECEYAYSEGISLKIEELADIDHTALKKFLRWGHNPSHGDMLLMKRTR